MDDDQRAQMDAARARTGFSGMIPDAGEALRMVQRHGDFSGIRTRLQLGIQPTPGELDALAALDRGDKSKTGRKEPGTDFEAFVCFRWLVERGGITPAGARSMLAEMTGATPGAIKARMTRAKGLGVNIVDLIFDLHEQHGVMPALLRYRTPAGHCRACKRVRCKCESAPRPEFADTPEAATLRALLAFWAT